MYYKTEEYKIHRSNYRKKKSLEYKEFIWNLKRNPCVDCKTQFHPWQMDFDHLKNKNRKVSNMKDYSKGSILKEIEKCDLVCANCHRDRTYKRLFVKRGA